MTTLHYPDSGQPLEDKAILRNAVDFGTGARALSSELVLRQSIGVSQTELAYLAVAAFAEFMQSTEDMLGWLFALQEWQPGTFEFSLFHLLYRIQVGRHALKKVPDYREERAVALLHGLDEQGFRRLIHIPSDEDLRTSGAPADLCGQIATALTPKLEGWRRIASRRADQDRGLVRAFNKLKHQMLALRTRTADKDEVWMPIEVAHDSDAKRTRLRGASLVVSSGNVRRWAGDAIAAQAILWDTLGLILWLRYGVEPSPPAWVLKAYAADYLWTP